MDAIRVPLDLNGFEVIDSEVVNGRLEVEVRSARNPACRHCGSLDVADHQRYLRRIRDRACFRPCCYDTSGGSGVETAAAPAESSTLRSPEGDRSPTGSESTCLSGR